MKANDTQVGGSHYASEYQHWDLVIATGMSYLPAQATRYLTRWRKKEGLKDLQKALHYIDKLRESVAAKTVKPFCTNVAFAEVMKFSLINGLSEREQIAVTELATWADDSQLANARGEVELLIAHEAEPGPVPASDSNKHADRADPSDPTGW